MLNYSKEKEKKSEIVEEMYRSEVTRAGLLLGRGPDFQSFFITGRYFEVKSFIGESIDPVDSQS